VTALLEVEGVSKAFGGVQALSECCLEVPEGSISGLIGPNGSGKTTLFNVMTGFERVTEGEVRLRGHQIVNSRPDRIFRQGMGRTFQLTRIFSRLTVMENMLVATQRQAQSVRNLVARAGSTVERRRAWDLLEFVGITRLADELAGNLSYGQRKLLELAYVLIADPTVILLDEPAGGVNPSLITLIADRIRELNRAGKTFLVVEHNMELVMSLCDRVTVMHQGRSILSGPPEIVRSDNRVLDAYLGTVLDGEEVSSMMAPAVPRAHEINGTGAPGTALGTGPPGDPEQDPLLVLDGVVAGYGGGDVLRGVSCTVPATGITCIVGPNGAGKSTLLATISGVLRPRLGEISFRGESLVGKNPREVLDRGIVR
jgi:neutral amino acid transport system ATP-binding protein